MNTSIRSATRRACMAAIGAALLAPVGGAWAQATVKLIVGYAAGGPVDAAARVFAPVFSRELGQHRREIGQRAGVDEGHEQQRLAAGAAQHAPAVRVRAKVRDATRCHALRVSVFSNYPVIPRQRGNTTLCHPRGAPAFRVETEPFERAVVLTRHLRGFAPTKCACHSRSAGHIRVRLDVRGGVGKE